MENINVAKLLKRARGMQMDANRSEWEFTYTARNLMTAAQAQRDHRLSRLKAWETKKAEVMAKVKETGLTIDESMAESMMNYQTTALGGRGAQIMVDTSLQRDLSECVGKINEHRAAAKEYDAWVQVLEANPESRLPLKHDDWMFFFGKR